MKRVGFLFNEDILLWNGGLNYYNNIFRIIIDSNKYCAVVFCPSSIKSEMNKRFKNVEIVSTEIVANNSIKGKYRKTMMYLFKKIPLLDALLKNYDINVLSHSTSIPLDTKSNIPSCNWIPDFQQFHLPEYFTKRDIKHQHFLNKLLIRNATRMIVSSNDAKQDLLRYYSFINEKSIDILRFSLPPISMIESTADVKVLQKYGVKKNEYFLVTNQFWRHKNHISIILALKKILESRKEIPFKIVATGKRFEPRNADYIKWINREISENNLEKLFICTDDIPYSDVCTLQMFCMAVIQPSLFEGWNTTVEECKRIGKKIVLSDIGIHREQNPDNVIFFNPYSAEQLADCLLKVYDEYDLLKENTMKFNAFNRQEERWKNFSNDYIEILNRTIENKGWIDL